MSIACLAMVADRPVTRVMPDGRISAIRSPGDGELYRWSQMGFARIQILVRSEELAIVTDTASLHAAQHHGPAAIVSAEGADFLDASLERVEEAYTSYQLRHLQLTHYRVNDLGDIQTEAPVHGGLTDFGADVIRACNRLGIVVDVAHGTYDLVKRAAAVTTKPLVLSHTSLSSQPGPRSRLISPDHARVIAGTGGVIGVWPPSTVFAGKAAMAAGMARLADVVGVDHVGLGSDMLGLTSPSVFASYSELPELAAAVLAAGFSPEDTGKILGGNYARVFAASVG
jgi:membrane dipeptidase